MMLQGSGNETRRAWMKHGMPRKCKALFGIIKQFQSDNDAAIKRAIPPIFCAFRGFPCPPCPVPNPFGENECLIAY